MPAAELSRLQAQISAISTQFDDPPLFLRSLLTLMELYGDQNFRPGDHSRVKHMNPEYHLPLLVIQQLGNSLNQLTAQNPDSAISTMDSLWQEKRFEARFLAAGMLGQYPAQFKASISERIQTWVRPDEDAELISTLLNSANHFFISNDLEKWLKQIQHWLDSKNFQINKIGLRGLQILVEDTEFEKFEKLYPLLEPIFIHPIFSLQKNTLEVIKSLIKRSEMETLAFLRSIFLQTKEPEVIRFIRRCIPFFSNEAQDHLKELINSV
jgi:hypothetical protein